MAKHNVSVSTGELKLPTYKLQGENRNPVFRSQYGVAHIYPYTLQDEIASTPSDVTYPTLVLENTYLRVTVIPDLGGRVYSVYDKISKREVFYKNPTVKFSPLAIRGAFFWAKAPHNMKTTCSFCSEIVSIILSVSLCQPRSAWEFDRLARTDKLAFKSNTPCSAQRVRSEEKSWGSPP